MAIYGRQGVSFLAYGSSVPEASNPYLSLSWFPMTRADATYEHTLLATFHHIGVIVERCLANLTAPANGAANVVRNAAVRNQDLRPHLGLAGGRAEMESG
jgi:hypothetical protein